MEVWIVFRENEDDSVTARGVFDNEPLAIEEAKRNCPYAYSSFHDCTSHVDGPYEINIIQ